MTVLYMLSSNAILRPCDNNKTGQLVIHSTGDMGAKEKLPWLPQDKTGIANLTKIYLYLPLNHMCCWGMPVLLDQVPPGYQQVQTATSY